MKKELEQIPCIWYPDIFKDQIETSVDSKSKENTTNKTFASELGLKIRKTNVEDRKIDNTTLQNYKIVVSTFSVLDKDSTERFFEKSFLFADNKSDVVLRILFLSMSNIDINFQAWDL